MKNQLLFFVFFAIGGKTFATESEELKCHCTGDGPYTIVMDAGMGNWSLFFRPIAEDLQHVLRVCLIDRAGYAKNDKTNLSVDALAVAHQMKIQLSRQGIEDSVILLGHSIGGLNVRMFQNLYPEMIKGMILLDAASSNLTEEMPEIETNLTEQIKKIKTVHVLAKLGLLKLAKDKIPTFGLPQKYHQEYYRIVTKPHYYQTYIKEMQTLSESLSQCKELDSLGDLPLLVISSQQGLNNDGPDNPESRSTWLKMQKELTLLSSNSTYIESTGDHFVHLSDPELVLSEVKKFYNHYFGNKLDHEI